jgi:flagellar motility protein MotE (MotC chaperone)
MRFRILPVLFGLMILTFTIRMGDMVKQIASGDRPQITSAQAFAEETKKEDKKAEAKPKEGKEGEKAPREEIPAKSADAETEVKGVEPDPFIQEYSDEEVKVLQSLSKRREQLDQRERDLVQREKLLQAAEKKVDEKVAELSKLRGELDTLLDNQQKVETESIAQLVKIYESMKPKDAANIFNDMDFDVLLNIIDKMSERKVAPVMAAMDPDRARDISRRLAEQRALPKKIDSAIQPGQ